MPGEFPSLIALRWRRCFLGERRNNAKITDKIDALYFGAIALGGITAVRLWRNIVQSQHDRIDAAPKSSLRKMGNTERLITVEPVIPKLIRMIVDLDVIEHTRLFQNQGTGLGRNGHSHVIRKQKRAFKPLA